MRKVTNSLCNFLSAVFWYRAEHLSHCRCSATLQTDWVWWIGQVHWWLAWKWALILKCLASCFSSYLVEDCCSIEDGRRLCHGREMLPKKSLFGTGKWELTLKVFLSPFLGLTQCRTRSIYGSPAALVAKVSLWLCSDPLHPRPEHLPVVSAERNARCLQLIVLAGAQGKILAPSSLLWLLFAIEDYLLMCNIDFKWVGILLVLHTQ